ncbi:MAG TPA: DUF2946 family protein [Burkholderiaceae bacterium]|nr:DUF2946 family protein [Burkholderiaceae bacterium]
MAKWPNVPACYGWLALDRRGRWRMRDEHAQQHGLLGDVIRNATLKQFIDRNYTHDEHGAWYFQNGPQRVYVNLEAAPYVLFSDTHGTSWRTHTGLEITRVDAVHLDDEGGFWWQTNVGIASVCDRDLAMCATHLRGGNGEPLEEDELLDRMTSAPHSLALKLELLQTNHSLRLQPIVAAHTATRFGFVKRPVAPA